ncbi:hypothetical protein [Streptomyces geranii]|uniref:hypothetical protein n=1 Tax=Streptomyces geranii TaxID=2058923 RepID=UPI000D0224B1|nr:hypothetical protein [Streptomyces geranii]
MPADEVTHGTDVDGSRGRTGPRHAAPRKPLFTRFHMPAGKAIALAAMPTAVLMGMGFTPTLANADDQPTTNSQKAEEYKDCVAAMAEDASASADPSETATESSSGEDEATATPSASATDSGSTPSDSSSSDSGSDDGATPTPTPSASKTTSSGDTGGDSDTATPTPSASASATEESGNLLETIGDAIVDIFTGGDESSSDSTSTTTTSTESTETSEPTATPTPTASAAPAAETPEKDTTDTTTVKDTTPKVTEVLKDTTDTAAKATETTTEAAEAAADEATASPTPSASSTTDVDDCPVATEDLGGVDNTIRLPDKPWTLQASSLLLKGADYQGIVKVRTADGTVKDVLKYVISDGTDIGDLHQLVTDDTSGKTYHVQAAKGSTSTITNGKTVMYTESISGNLFGLIPVTFSPKSPPPLNIPLIYFTNVKVTQAGQFGGTLKVPGLHQFTT